MDVDEDDPIVTSYPVFLTVPLPSTRRVLVLEHTSQKPEHLDTRPFTPLEVRLKPRSGMVEVDNPMETLSAYDREKGLNWGLKLSASTAAKSGGSHGLPGGFGVGAPPPRPKRRPEGELDEDLSMDWNTAVARDKVLRLQTLGGQIPTKKEAEYMIGVFQDKGLHLTPVTSMVNLRPQLHHIDAEAQEAQQISRAQAAASKDGVAPSANGVPLAAGGPGAPRAIHMTIKNAGDGDGDTTETMADRLRAVQTESWRKHSVIGEAEEEKWNAYYHDLALDSKTGGDEDMDMDEIDDELLEEHYGRLETNWGEQELLEAVSGLKKEVEVVEIKDEDDKGNGVGAPPPAKNVRQATNRTSDIAVAESETPKKGRPRGKAAAPRRGGKPRVSKGGSSGAADMTDV